MLRDSFEILLSKWLERNSPPYRRAMDQVFAIPRCEPWKLLSLVFQNWYFSAHHTTAMPVYTETEQQIWAICVCVCLQLVARSLNCRGVDGRRSDEARSYPEIIKGLKWAEHASSLLNANVRYLQAATFQDIIRVTHMDIPTNLSSAWCNFMEFFLRSGLATEDKPVICKMIIHHLTSQSKSNLYLFTRVRVPFEALDLNDESLLSCSVGLKLAYCKLGADLVFDTHILKTLVPALNDLTERPSNLPDSPQIKVLSDVLNYSKQATNVMYNLHVPSKLALETLYKIHRANGNKALRLLAARRIILICSLSLEKPLCLHALRQVMASTAAYTSYHELMSVYEPILWPPVSDFEGSNGVINFMLTRSDGQRIVRTVLAETRSPEGLSKFIISSPHLIGPLCEHLLQERQAEDAVALYLNSPSGKSFSKIRNVLETAHEAHDLTGFLPNYCQLSTRNKAQFKSALSSIYCDQHGYYRSEFYEGILSPVHKYLLEIMQHAVIDPLSLYGILRYSCDECNLDGLMLALEFSRARPSLLKWQDDDWIIRCIKVSESGLKAAIDIVILYFESYPTPRVAKLIVNALKASRNMEIVSVFLIAIKSSNIALALKSLHWQRRELTLCDWDWIFTQEAVAIATSRRSAGRLSPSVINSISDTLEELLPHLLNTARYLDSAALAPLASICIFLLPRSPCTDVFKLLVEHMVNNTQQHMVSEILFKFMQNKLSSQLLPLETTAKYLQTIFSSKSIGVLGKSPKRPFSSLENESSSAVCLLESTMSRPVAKSALECIQVTSSSSLITFPRSGSQTEVLSKLIQKEMTSALNCVDSPSCPWFHDFSYLLFLYPGLVDQQILQKYCDHLSDVQIRAILVSLVRAVLALNLPWKEMLVPFSYFFRLAIVQQERALVAASTMMRLSQCFLDYHVLLPCLNKDNIEAEVSVQYETPQYELVDPLVSSPNFHKACDLISRTLKLFCEERLQIQYFWPIQEDSPTEDSALHSTFDLVRPFLTLLRIPPELLNARRLDQDLLTKLMKFAQILCKIDLSQLLSGMQTGMPRGIIVLNDDYRPVPRPLSSTKVTNSANKQLRLHTSVRQSKENLDVCEL